MVNRHPGYIRRFVPFACRDAALCQDSAYRQEQFQLINDLRLPIPVILTGTWTHNDIAFPIGLNFRDRAIDDRVSHDFRPAAFIECVLLSTGSRHYAHFLVSQECYTPPPLASRGERAVADYLPPYPTRSVFKRASRGPIQHEEFGS